MIINNHNLNKRNKKNLKVKFNLIRQPHPQIENIIKKNNKIKIIKKIIIFFIQIKLFEHAIFEFRSKLGRLLSSNIILNLNIIKEYKMFSKENIYKIKILLTDSNLKE